MKGIRFTGAITSLSDRQDSSLRLSVVTPEVDNTQMGIVRNLKNMALKITLEPEDYAISDVAEVQTELNEKSPSQRLRNVMYVFWQKSTSDETFEAFYRRKMEGIINTFKDKLD